MNYYRTVPKELLPLIKKRDEATQKLVRLKNSDYRDLEALEEAEKEYLEARNAVLLESRRLSDD